MADLNIPSGEGLLEAQQQDAAQIPYKNIELADAGIKGFMNAFQMQQQIGNKRRALEQQLQIAYMKNDMDQEKFSMSMDNMQTRHAIELARLQQTASHQGDMLEMAGRGMELREAGAALDQKKFNFAVDKQNDRIAGTEAILDVENELAQEGITPESPNYFKEYSSRINAKAASAPASTFNKALSLARNKVNDTSDRMLKDNMAKRTAFAEEVGRTYFGDPKFQDFRLLDPANLEDKVPEKSLADRFGWAWGRQEPPRKPSDIKVYKYQTSAGEKQVEISSKKLTELNKAKGEIDDEYKRIPSKVPRSAIPSSTNDPEPLPANKQDLVVGHTYRGQGGVGTWNGSGFDPVQ